MAAGNYRLLNCSIVANLLLLLLLTRAAGASISSAMMGSCRSAAECATAGGGVVIGEEPVMMDSETNNRLIESATGNHHFLSYRALGSEPACKAAVQNSCFGDQKYGKKKCGVYHRTCGAGSGH